MSGREGEGVGRRAKGGGGMPLLLPLCAKGALLCFHACLIACNPRGAGCQGWANVPNHARVSVGSAAQVLAAVAGSFPCQLLQTGSRHVIHCKTHQRLQTLPSCLDSFWPRRPCRQFEEQAFSASAKPLSGRCCTRVANRERACCCSRLIAGQQAGAFGCTG